MKTIITRILFSVIFCFGLLLTFILNPCIAYSHTTVYKSVTIFHKGELDKDILTIIDLSLETVRGSRIYTPNFRPQLCLNQTIYPKIIKGLLGDDVFRAFSNKVVVLGEASNNFNRFYKWDKELKYSQFLTHALLHNLQFKQHGFWDANPLGRYPEWKWEGYVEYETLGNLISLPDLIDLINNRTIDDYEWVWITKQEGTIKQHLQYCAMVKYCFDVLEWDYNKLMTALIDEETLMNEVQNYISKAY